MRLGRGELLALRARLKQLGPLGDDGEERVHHRRVELCTRAPAQLGEGRLDSQRVLMGANGDHRDEGVADGDDARPEGISLPASPSG